MDVSLSGLRELVMDREAWRAAIHARGEGERVLALESREGTRASRRVEEGLSRSLSGGRRENPRFPRILPGTLGAGGLPVTLWAPEVSLQC